MKKLMFLFLSPLLLASCHESLEQRAAREAREFTEKNCPQDVNENMVYDSLTFDSSTRTFHYWYTISGRADDDAVIARSRKQISSQLLESIRSDIGTKNYKEAGFGFAVTCHSAKQKGKVLFQQQFTQKDYK